MGLLIGRLGQGERRGRHRHRSSSHGNNRRGRHRNDRSCDRSSSGFARFDQLKQLLDDIVKTEKKKKKKHGKFRLNLSGLSQSVLLRDAATARTCSTRAPAPQTREDSRRGEHSETPPPQNQTRFEGDVLPILLVVSSFSSFCFIPSGFLRKIISVSVTPKENTSAGCP